MEKQNITLSIPKDILLRVKFLAVKRETSVSGMLTKILEKVVREEDDFVHARRRHLKLLEVGEDLGTGGVIGISRDELHERG